MNEEAAKKEIAALADRMVELSQGQSMDIYVSALIHTVRICADVVPSETSHEIGRIMLRVGGLLVQGIGLSDGPNAAPISPSTSIH